MAKFDIYSAVTERIIHQPEQGHIPWAKPWTGIQGGAFSGATEKPYSLLNQMLLNRPGPYYTFSQVQKLGGAVRKGEKSQMVVFWKKIPVQEPDPVTGQEQETFVPMLRYYNVFHADQCDGLPAASIRPQSRPESSEAEAIIQRYLQRSGVTLVRQVSDEAYYSPARDRVVLPLQEQFCSMAEYYSTAFHELAHSTGHHSRLNRLHAAACFGSDRYSKEELVAEISAAALVNHAGLETPGTFRNSTAYIQSWLAALKNDRRLIVTASGAAAKAFDLITAN